MQVVDIDRVVVATDDLDRTSKVLNDRLGIDFGELMSLSPETTTGEDGLRSVIDTAGIGIDIIQPDDEVGNNTVANFIETYGSGLYAIAFRVDDLEIARTELAADGVEPVGEISSGDFTEYLYHPRDFDGLFVFLAEFPHSFETNFRMEELGESC